MADDIGSSQQKLSPIGVSWVAEQSKAGHSERDITKRLFDSEKGSIDLATAKQYVQSVLE
jgi:hypothetical protein